MPLLRPGRSSVVTMACRTNAKKEKVKYVNIKCCSMHVECHLTQFPLRIACAQPRQHEEIPQTKSSGTIQEALDCNGRKESGTQLRDSWFAILVGVDLLWTCAFDRRQKRPRRTLSPSFSCSSPQPRNHLSSVPRTSATAIGGVEYALSYPAISSHRVWAEPRCTSMAAVDARRHGGRWPIRLLCRLKMAPQKEPAELLRFL